jgi:hypothetical protein
LKKNDFHGFDILLDFLSFGVTASWTILLHCPLCYLPIGGSVTIVVGIAVVVVGIAISGVKVQVVSN